MQKMFIIIYEFYQMMPLEYENFDSVWKWLYFYIHEIYYA